MSKQQNFTDIEYAQRKRQTKREIFLAKMDSVVPWEAWCNLVKEYYPKGERGRKPKEIEVMLRMTMLQNWFNLSDEGIEDAIYDSYAMKGFLGINFSNNEQVPDATTLCKFRKLLNENHLQENFFAQVQTVLAAEGKQVTGGTIVDATIIEASSSKKNKLGSTDEDMHSVKKGTQWHFGMRAHIGVDPLHGFVHTLVTTPANIAEVKVAPQLLRKENEVVYGDAGYLKLERYVTDNFEREYRINRQIGTFKKHYGNDLAWKLEKPIEMRKSSMRCKVEYVFHIVKDIFCWRKTRYKGIFKNQCKANLLFASANLYMLANCKSA